MDISFTVCVCACVCTVMAFSTEDKASGVKFCTVIHRRPRQGVSYFGELCSPRSPKTDQSDTTGKYCLGVYPYPIVNVTLQMRRSSNIARHVDV